MNNILHINELITKVETVFRDLEFCLKGTFVLAAVSAVGVSFLVYKLLTHKD
jgi:hypothetical protein